MYSHNMEFCCVRILVNMNDCKLVYFRTFHSCSSLAHCFYLGPEFSCSESQRQTLKIKSSICADQWGRGRSVFTLKPGRFAPGKRYRCAC